MILTTNATGSMKCEIFISIHRDFVFSFENATAKGSSMPSVPVRAENHPEVMLSASEASASTSPS